MKKETEPSRARDRVADGDAADNHGDVKVDK